jgi:hypothetical protein
MIFQSLILFRSTREGTLRTRCSDGRCRVESPARTFSSQTTALSTRTCPSRSKSFAMAPTRPCNLKLNQLNNYYFVKIFLILNMLLFNKRFDTTQTSMVFSDQLLQITTRLSSPYVFGIGESSKETFMHDVNFKSWPLFASQNHPSQANAQTNVQFSAHTYLFKII